jgi:hypothetical protein
MSTDKFTGLDVLVREDGVYLAFESKEGKAMISLSAIADGRGKNTGGVIKAWCEEARGREKASRFQRI